MRNKLLGIFFVFLALSVHSMFASEKETVYVDNFSYPATIDKSHVEMLRNRIISGITFIDRVTVKDVNNEATLKPAKNAKVKAKTEATDVDAATLAKLQKLNANYLLQGHVTTMQTTKGLRKDSTERHNGLIAYTLKIVDLSSGATIATETYNYPGAIISFSTAGNTAAEALDNTMKPVAEDMAKLTDVNFRIKGAILQVSKENKGKAQEVQINLGTTRGIEKGDKFEVLVANNKVGEIQVEVVEADALSRCKVNGGKAQEAIKAAMDQGEAVRILSMARGKTLMGEGKKMFGF